MHFVKIALGTVQFGIPYGISNRSGQTPAVEVGRILAAARRFGIRLLDTASAYGNAEEVLGSCALQDFHVVSKFRCADNPSSLRAQMNRSLAALRIDCFYGYLAHRPEELIGHPDLWRELTALKSEGLILKRGFSLNRPSELPPLLDAGFIPEILQVPYNYLDRRFENLMKELQKSGCEIHCRSTFLQGLFFTNPESLPLFFSEVKPILRQLQLLGPQLPGALLRFVMEKPFVDRVIIGVENREQLTKNMEKLDSDCGLPELEGQVSDNILMPMNWPAR